MKAFLTDSLASFDFRILHRSCLGQAQIGEANPGASIPFSFLSSSTHTIFLTSQTPLYSIKRAHQSTRNINSTVQTAEYDEVALSETIVPQSVWGPLYSQGPSQLLPPGPCTGFGSSTRSDRTAPSTPPPPPSNQSQPVRRYQPARLPPHMDC